MHVLLRQRISAFNSLENTLGIAAEQMRSLQRVEPVAVLAHRRLQVVFLRLLDGAQILGRWPFAAKAVDFFHHGGSQAFDVLGRAAELNAGDSIARLRRRVRVVHANGVGPAKLLAQNVAESYLKHLGCRLEAMRFEFLESCVRKERNDGLTAWFLSLRDDFTHYGRRELETHVTLTGVGGAL